MTFQWLARRKLRVLALAILAMTFPACMSLGQGGTHSTGFAVQEIITASATSVMMPMYISVDGGTVVGTPVLLELETNAAEIEVSGRIDDMPNGLALAIQLHTGGAAVLWHELSETSAWLGSLLTDENGHASCSIVLKGRASAELGLGQHALDLILEFASATVSASLLVEVPLTAGSQDVYVEIAGPSQVYIDERAAYSASVLPDHGCVVEWSFGDGTARQQGDRVEHSFDQVGTFPVRAVASCEGDQTGEATLTVEVAYRPPTAVLSTVPAGILSVSVGERVVFSADSSTPGSGDIDEYIWDFDYDGAFTPSRAVGPIVAHSFSETGSHVVAVRVIDRNGLHDTATLRLDVLERAEPVWQLTLPEQAAGGGGAFGSLEIDELLVRFGADCVSSLCEDSAGLFVAFPLDEGRGQSTEGTLGEAYGGSRQISAEGSDISWVVRETREGSTAALSLGNLGMLRVDADPALALDSEEAFEIQLWIRAEASSDAMSVLQQGCFDGAGVGLHLYQGYPLLGFESPGLPAQFLLGSLPIDDAIWHQVVCRVELGYVSIALDSRIIAISEIGQALTTRASGLAGQALNLGADPDCPAFGEHIQLAIEKGQELVLFATAVSDSAEPPVIVSRPVDGRAGGWRPVTMTSKPEGGGGFRLAIALDDIEPGVHEVTVAGSAPRSTVVRVLVLPTQAQGS